MNDRASASVVSVVPSFNVNGGSATAGDAAG
jgi:hypothetical protein